jgi:hypothetical protein
LPSQPPGSIHRIIFVGAVSFVLSISFPSRPTPAAQEGVWFCLLRPWTNSEVPNFKRFLIHLSAPLVPATCLLAQSPRPIRSAPPTPQSAAPRNTGFRQTGCRTSHGRSTVKDASGRVVPAAKVTMVQTATNQTDTTQTNNVGFFLFPALGVGTYEITVEVAGMASWKAKLPKQPPSRRSYAARLNLVPRTATCGSAFRTGLASVLGPIKVGVRRQA